MTTWPQELQNLFHNANDLFNYLEIPQEKRPHVPSHNFTLRVPRPFADRMEKGNPDDPLLKQILPTLEEMHLESSLGLSADPLEEKAFQYSPGILKKFQGRVLIIATGYCPVHCRYCFRRHFDYQSQQFSQEKWELSIKKIQSDPNITEIIFSGGDPLTLPDSKIESLFNQISLINHVKTVRIHTRFPIVIPSRLTADLKKLITNYDKKIVIVLHINHPNEIDTGLQNTLLDWNRSGILFFNQAVLLKGVNNSVETQIALWQRCFESGVLAYYLHQFDLVEGAGHFHVPIKQGQKIMKILRKALPGYMVPTYVQEIPHAGSKIPLESYSDEFLL